MAVRISAVKLDEARSVIESHQDRHLVGLVIGVIRSEWWQKV